MLFTLLFNTFYSMEKWTDKAIREHIEELIEESYLLCLSNQEIREYFSEFLDVCDRALRTNLSIQGNTKIARIKIALLRARLYVTENPVRIMKRNNYREGEKSHHEILAKQIVVAKRAITRLLEGINPRIACEALNEIEKRNVQRKKISRRRTKIISVLIKAGYFLLLFGALSLVWFVGFR